MTDDGQKRPDKESPTALPGEVTKEAPTALPGEVTKEAPTAFPGEITREWDIREAGRASAARTEIGFESPAAAEETSQVVLPASRARRTTVAQEAAQAAQWPQRPDATGWFRRQLDEDPVVQWYRGLRQASRRRFSLSIWVVATASAIVGIFLWSSLGIFPWLEGYLRPYFAPHPVQAVRTQPREGAVLDLVEERAISMSKFVMGEDHVWVAVDPSAHVEVNPDAMELLHDGNPIASLDVRKNWDGLLRVYFRAGDVIPGTPLQIRLAIVDGGMWSVKAGDGYQLFRLGGAIPAAVTVGPVLFTSK